MRRLACSGVLFLLPFATAQEPQNAAPEGHSHLSQAFDEGPRQAAYLMAGMNDAVRFPVTTANPAAQRFFDQGVVQLHGFWYFEAERSFRQAAKLDPDCAMAYWGMALCNVDNEKRAHGFAREAFTRRDRASPREQQWIDAYARYWSATEAPAKEADGKPKDWVKPSGGADAARRQRLGEDLDALVADRRDDIEAKALVANQLWVLWRDAGQPIPSRAANDALLEDVFAAVPLHPAHHYRIHLWDTRETAARVVPSAAVIGHCAPGIAHLWHMGGHIFDQLDRHADAAWHQEASARVDHAHMIRDGVMPDQIHNYAHNNEWLCRSLMNVGRVNDAIDLARNMVELPRHPKWNHAKARSSSSKHGPRRLAEVLARFECWDRLRALADTMYLEPGGDPEQRAEFLFLLGRAALEGGDAEAARARLAELDALVAEQRAARAAAIDAAEDESLAAGKPVGDAEKAMDEAQRKVSAPLRSVRDARRELADLLRWHAGEREAALDALAKANYDALHRSRLQLELGRNDDAEKSARDAAKARGRAYSLANLVDVLWRIGKRDDARREFEALRAISSRFDLEYAPFARLAPVAAELGFPADWRIADAVPADVGHRPPLDTLGPLHWSPRPAPGFVLPAADGAMTQLTDRTGRPVLVVFFLGFGCVHCVEQLRALAPRHAAFAAAGIDVIAIGTDTVADLARAAESASEDERQPFPILADPALRAFRAWRCHDDFEEMPLHGTFLVDGKGLVRWQDIGPEPFMELDWLLVECRRLLALGSVP
jgi:peroxiredoxin